MGSLKPRKAPNAAVTETQREPMKDSDVKSGNEFQYRAGNMCFVLDYIRTEIKKDCGGTTFGGIWGLSKTGTG